MKTLSTVEKLKDRCRKISRLAKGGSLRIRAIERIFIELAALEEEEGHDKDEMENVLNMLDYLL